MTVSIEATSRKYRGRKAETYEDVRTKQIRWQKENDAVEQMMVDLPRNATVLDCPVGTGRFIPMLTSMGYRVHGIDVSEEMLALAKNKIKNGKRVTLERRSADDLGALEADAALCIRFLDLIDERAMRRVMNELMRVARSRIVLTIRLGEKYVPKSNTATHDERRFLTLVKKGGWRVTKSVSIFKAGWAVIKLERQKS